MTLLLPYELTKRKRVACKTATFWLVRSLLFCTVFSSFSYFSLFLFITHVFTGPLSLLPIVRDHIAPILPGLQTKTLSHLHPETMHPQFSGEINSQILFW